MLGAKNMKITFYTGPQCSLCDLAQNLIDQLNTSKFEVEKVNVRTSPELYHLYGARIPVLKIDTPNGPKELGWPFNLEQLELFIS